MDSADPVVLRRRRTVHASPCPKCCGCCRRRSSHQEEGRGHRRPLRPYSLHSIAEAGPLTSRLTQEPLYEEVLAAGLLLTGNMQTLDVRLLQSREELLERGLRDFQYPDSGLGSEPGSLGRGSSTEVHVEAGEEFLFLEAGVAEEVGAGERAGAVGRTRAGGWLGHSWIP